MSSSSALRAERLSRIFLTLPALSLLIYGSLALVLNSGVTSPIVDLIVGWRFSGELSWERSSWGPAPWDVRVLNATLTDGAGEEVARVHSIEVDDFLYLGLLEDHISALGARVVSPRVTLKERPHLYKPRTLEWNVAELFQPPHPNPDDGAPLPPITLALLNLSLSDGEVSVEMGVTQQRAQGVQVTGGRFNFELERTWMSMHADEVKVTQGRSVIWVRDLSSLAPRDRVFLERKAPIELTLDYPVRALSIDSFWWAGDQFGASQIKGSLFDADQLIVRDGMLSLIKGGTPEMSGRVSAMIKSLVPYVSPWGLGELLRGEVSAQAELYGPVSDPCARALSTTGQLFLPHVGAARFDLKASKDLQDLATLDRLRVWSRAGDFDVMGALNLRTLRGLFNVKLNSVKWSAFTPIPLSWRPWGVDATGGLTLKVRPHDEHTVELGAELMSRMEGPAPLSVDARATLAGSLLELHYAKLTLGAPHAQRARTRRGRSRAVDLRGSGQVDLGAQRLRLALSAQASISPSMLPPLSLPLRGDLSLKVSVEGPLTQPRLTGLMDGRRLRGQAEGFKWAIDRLHLPFQLTDDQLKLNQFSFRGRSGEMEGSLSIPLERPERLQGWSLIHSLPVDLNPVDVPFSAQLTGVACTGGGGCSGYFNRHPLSKRALEDDCLKHLVDRLKEDTRDRKGVPALELCMSGKGVKYEQFSLNELGVSARWDSEARRAIIRRARMWKGPRLLLDAEGQVDLRAGQFQSHAKLLDFPLQLVQLFTADPPPELKTLYGLVEGELSLGGRLSRPIGRGALSARRVSLKLSNTSPPLPVELGLAELTFHLSKTGLNAEGHLGRQVWLNASVPFEGGADRVAQLGVDLFDVPLSVLYAVPQGEVGFQAELKGLRKQVAGDDGLMPLSLSDPDESLRVFALGRPSYCALSALSLPSSSLTMLALQGHVDMSLPLGGPDAFKPTLRADLEGLRLEHWIRDALGALVSLGDLRGEAGGSACHSLCGVERCATIELHSQRPAHIEVRSVAEVADHVYLNPEPSLSPPSTSSQPWVSGWRPGEYIQLRPLTLTGPYHSLTLSGALLDGSLSASLEGRSAYSTLGLFLDGLFQRLEGTLSASLKARGPVSSPQVEGSVTLSDVAMLSPRSQVIGDIRLTQPLHLTLEGLPKGGLKVTLPAVNGGVTLLRDEGEIILNELEVELPELTFTRLSVGFSARQLEAKLPELGRFTTQLKAMRFIMDSERTPERPDLLLEGEVDILRGLYTADVVSSDEINQGVRNNFTGRTAVETLSVFDRSPILKRLRLNLTIQGEDDLLVRNQVGGVVKLNLGVALKLNVKGYLYALPSDPIDQQLRLSGEVNTLDGSTITYANNTFDVIDGRVTFGSTMRSASQASTFMSAELEATHTFRIPRQSLSRQQVNFDRNLGSDLIDEEVTLRAQVLMPTKESRPQVELDLSSQSGASKIEVATLVITGRYPNNLNAAASTQPATEVLLAPILNLIERPIEDSLGLNLSLTPETSGAGLFIDLNKSFSRRLRLYARTPIGEGDDDTPQSFGVEYKLNNFLSSELTREQVSQINATSGRLRLRLSWE